MWIARSCLALVVLILAVAQPQARSLHVYAAASTIDPVLEINAMFEKSGRGKALAAFGSTGMLAHQIEYGAPADVLVSANAKWMDYLAGLGKLVAGTRRVVAANRLALIRPLKSSLSLTIGPGFPLAAALKGGRLAIADPAHSPAGAYARAALQHFGVWDSVRKRTALAANVRQALLLVERAQAPAGIVYASDAGASRLVAVVGVFPAGTHPPIRYEAALIAGRQTESARAYLALLASPKGRAAFRRHGIRAE